MVIGVQERAGVFPFIPTPPSGPLLTRVRDGPTLGAEIEVDLLVRESDPLTGEDLPDLSGPAGATVPLRRDELLLDLGERRTLGAAVGVEAGHNPRSTPA